MEPNVPPARHIEMATPIAAGPRAGERPTAPQVVRLYEEGAPGAVGGTGTEMEYSAWGACLVRNVVNPTLTVFLPDPADATGAAVIVAPGGAFCWLSWDVEGTMVAEWLRDHGVAGAWAALAGAMAKASSGVDASKSSWSISQSPSCLSFQSLKTQNIQYCRTSFPASPGSVATRAYTCLLYTSPSPRD